MKKVYMAGPITGLAWNESEDWRDAVKNYAALDPERFGDIQFFSPLRGKDYLKNHPEIKDSYPDLQFSAARSIMLRDHMDVVTSNALLVNFVGAKRVSIGTVMEVAWAYERKIPVIAIIEGSFQHKTGFDASAGVNIHEHSMLNEAIWYRFETVEEGMHAINLLFNP